MVRKYAGYVLLFMVLMVPINVFGYECDYIEKSRLQNIAKNFTYSMDYVIKDDIPTITVTITNLNSEIYITDKDTELEYHYDENAVNPNEVIIVGIEPGVKKTFYTYPESGICELSYKSSDLSLLITKIINIPYYNRFSDSEECDAFESQPICYKWSEYEISEKRFTEAMAELEERIKTPAETKEEELVPIFEQLLNFIFQYYMFILSGVIVAGMIGIIILKNRDNYKL